MSNDDENIKTINDDALEIFTSGTMRDVVTNYHDRLDMDNVAKIMEREIGKKLSPWIPDRYTEVDVRVMVGIKNIVAITEYMTDNRTKMLVAYNDEKPTNTEPWFEAASFLRPPPTSWAPVTPKTSEIIVEKPKIDFSTISSLSAPTNNGLQRFTNNMHVAVDLAKVDVHQEYIDSAAKKIADQIDRQVLQSIIATTTEIPGWAVATAGWTKETTTWSAMEEISFSEADLDELIDLVNDVQSEVMKFE